MNSLILLSKESYGVLVNLFMNKDKFGLFVESAKNKHKDESYISRLDN